MNAAQNTTLFAQKAAEQDINLKFMGNKKKDDCPTFKGKTKKCKMAHPVAFFDQINTWMGRLGWITSDFSWVDISMSGGSRDVEGVMDDLINDIDVDASSGLLKKVISAIKNKTVNDGARRFWSSHSIDEQTGGGSFALGDFRKAGGLI